MAEAAALPPGGVIGVVGGGQLGRMLALAAASLGYRCHVLTGSADDPAALVVRDSTVAAYDDEAALARFADAVDVVTFEFENLPVACLEFLAARLPVRPGPGVLAVCQDRIREKAFLVEAGAAVAPWRPVADAREARAALAEIGGTAVLKTARLGYDGKGQARLEPGDDAGAAFDWLGGVPCVLEGFVDFAYEASVIVARGTDGGTAAFDPVLNRHADHILACTEAPAPMPPATAAEARDLAMRLADRLGVVGLLAAELFVTRDDRLLVNELAPRPHNSGHWTIEACVASQFEQAVRAVAGLPLGDPSRRFDAVMDNLIGEAVGEVPRLLGEPGAHVHLYGKDEARPGRKMGHVTRLRPRGDR